MFLRNLFKTFRSHTLRATYEQILATEYSVPIYKFSSYEEDPQNYPKAESIIEIEHLAFELLNSRRKSGLMPNYIWRRLLSRLLDSIPEHSKIHSREFFIGQVPDPRFNACVIPITNNKFLILVNAGLMLFVFRMSRIFIACSRFVEGDAFFEPEISLEQAGRLSQENLDAIFRNQHCSPLQLKQPVMIKTSQLLCEAIEMFTLAHELGHVLLQGKEMDSKIEEVAADTLGYLIYHKAADDLVREWEAPDHIARPLIGAAPNLFFILAEMLENRAKKQGIKLADTHPNAKIRSINLYNIQVEQEKAYLDQISKVVRYFYQIVS